MKGFSLLEVLLTLMLISLGFIGIIGMQLTAVKSSKESYLRSLANNQLLSMAERLHANESTSARSSELIAWNKENSELLPEGKGNFSCSAAVCTLIIQWVFGSSHSLKLLYYERIDSGDF